MRRIARWMVGFGMAFALAILSASIAHTFPDPGVQRTNVRFNSSDSPAIATLQVTIGKEPADIYLPKSAIETLPLMLPGALVNRAYYSQFASAVARQGFAVVVPTHERSLPDIKLSGEIAEASQITTTLEFLKQENANPKSALYQKLNPSRMALLGHSL